MSKQLTMKAGVAISAALALAVALAILAFAYQPVGAQETSTSVTRSFSADEVQTGGTVDVTISSTVFLATVTETLPDDWTYEAGSASVVEGGEERALTAGEITVDGQDITFDVVTGQPVTYTAMAPGMAGTGMFSGTVSTQDGAYVGGDTTVTVGSAPMIDSTGVTRSFSTSQVDPGGTLDVTITLNTGFLVKVTETLPDGWTYLSVMPADVDVDLDGQMITFYVLNGEPVTYTVMAPDMAGSGTFSGMFTVTGTPNIMVGGDTTVTVDSVPMVELSIDDNQPLMVRIGSPVPVIATFTEAVSSFTVDDIAVVNGTVSNFAAATGGMVYTFDVTPSDFAQVTVDIAADVAMDADGNGNAAAPQLSFTPYDDDGVPGISRAEAIVAVRDYFSGKLTRTQVIAVILLYFASGS